MLKIGRCGIDVALDDPEVWNLSGSKVELSGWVQASTVADAMALRQQLLGYVDSRDEIAVPVTWSEDATNDGWYYVTDAAVDTTPVSLNTGWFAFSVTLLRVGAGAGGYSGPQLQSTLIGKLRTNGVGITTGSNWHGFPSTALDYWRGFANTLGTPRVGASGTALLHIQTGVSAAFTMPATFFLPPVNAYDAASTLRTASTASSAALRTVVGRQVVQPAIWEVSNGLVRVDNLNVSTPGWFAVSTYHGGAWQTAASFKLYDASAVFDVLLAPQITVLRNSPEYVALRVRAAHGGGINYGRVNVDFTIRRGDRLVQCVLSGDQTAQWGITPTSTFAATALTGGLRRTANNANGDREVVLSPQAVTTTLGTGAMSAVSGAHQFPFAVGFEVGGSGSASPERAVDLQDQYFFVNNERQSVIGR